MGEELNLRYTVRGFADGEWEVLFRSNYLENAIAVKASPVIAGMYDRIVIIDREED